MSGMGFDPMMPMAQPSIKCPECGEQSGFVAIKCQKCEEIFIPDPMSQEAADKCPKCGYSKFEEK